MADSINLETIFFTGTIGMTSYVARANMTIACDVTRYCLFVCFHKINISYCWNQLA